MDTSTNTLHNVVVIDFVDDVDVVVVDIGDVELFFDEDFLLVIVVVTVIVGAGMVVMVMFEVIIVEHFVVNGF